MTKAKLTEQAPVLLVRNIIASVDYWRDCLGFKAQLYGEPPEFAILRRDTCFMILAQAPEDHEVVPHWKIRDKTWNAYFWVDDALKLYEEFLASGAKIDYTPCDSPITCLSSAFRISTATTSPSARILTDLAQPPATRTPCLIFCSNFSARKSPHACRRAPPTI